MHRTAGHTLRYILTAVMVLLGCLTLVSQAAGRHGTVDEVGLRTAAPGDPDSGPGLDTDLGISTPSGVPLCIPARVGIIMLAPVVHEDRCGLSLLLVAGLQPSAP